MKRRKIILILSIMLVAQVPALSQIDTFFHVPPILKFTRDLPELNNVRFLFSTEFSSSTVTISSTDGSYSQTVTVQRGQVVTVTMPNNSSIDAAYGSQGRNTPSAPRSDIGITIRATNPITVVQFQDRANNSDLITLKGSKGLGTDFYCGSQVNPNNNPTAASNDDLHFIGILATEDGTTVQVSGNPYPLHGFATPGIVHLQKGQAILLRSSSQNHTIAGTRIQSNKPISVTSGGNHIRNRSVAGTAADAGIDHLIPVSAVGNTYFAVKGGATQSNEYLVIIPTTSSTLRVNGISISETLEAGKVFVYTFPSTDPIGRSYFIELSAPSYVYQVTGRNNSNELGMCLLPPSVCTGAPYVAFNLMPQFNHEMTVMLPTSSLQSFRLNGRSLQQLGITPVSMSALPSWSTWRILQSQLDSTNLFIANESMHVSLRATMNATGLFGYVSGYFQNLSIYDAATGLPVPDYFDLGTGCPGKTIAGCFRIESCDQVHRIDSAYAIKGSFIEWLNDTCYRLSPPAIDYVGVDTVVFYISNSLGQKKIVSGIANWQGVVTKANAGNDRVIPLKDTLEVYGNTLNGAIYSWRQIGGPSILTFNSSNMPHSVIEGWQLGEYQLEYTVTTACGIDKDTIVLSMVSPSNQENICAVQLPPDFIECNSSAVVVASNIDYRPIYSNQLPTNRYSWHISGGPFNFQGGTDSTYAFPKFKLEVGNIYRIILSFTTQGVSCTDTQWVYRAAPPIATIIDPPSVQLCNWPDTIWLQATTIGPVQQRTWTGSGTGFFIQPNQNETGYVLSSLDKSLTSLSFFFLAQGRTNGSCSFSASDTLTLALPTIHQAFAGIDRELCLQDTVQLQPQIPQVGTGTWRVLQSPNTPIIENNILRNVAAGSYQLEWRVENGICVASLDTVAITLIAPPTKAFAGIDRVLCLQDTVQLEPQLPQVGNGSWRVLQSPNSPIIENNILRNVVAGTYEIEWRVENGICSPSLDTVTITFIAPPSKSNAGIDRVLCLQDTVQLQPQIPQVGTGTWRVLQSPNTPIIENNILRNVVAGTYEIEWRVENGVCSPSLDTVSITFVAPPSKAFAGLDRELCLQDTVQLEPQLPQVGNGSWRVLQSPNSPIIENNILRNVVAGTYEIEWRVENGICSPSLDTVTITFIAPPSKSNAGIDRVLCLQDTVQLQPQIPQVGTGTWRVLQSPNSPIIENNVLRNVVAGNYQLEWRVENGICGASLDTVAITLIAPPSKAFAGIDREICLQDTVQLQPQTPQVGNGTWRVLQSPNSPIIENNILRNVVAGNYQLEWRVENGVCSPSLDTVTITFVASPSKAFAGLDRELCLQDTVQLQPQIPQVGAGIWKILQSPNSPIIENNILRNLIAGTYELEWGVENGVCASSFDTVSITFVAPPSKAFAGLNRELCLQDTVQLQPQIPQVGTGAWRVLQSPNSPIIENNILRNVVAGTYELEWGVENGVCASSFDTVTITFIAPPSKSNAGVDRVLCLQDTVQLQPQIPQVGTGAWRVLQSPNSPIIENNILRNVVAGTYELEWGVKNGVCASSFDTVSFKILAPIENEIYINDTIVCPTASYIVENKTLSGGNGMYAITWYINKDENGWSKIADSSISLSMQMTGERLVFRRQVVSGSCTSVSQTSYIRPLIILENTLVGNQSICVGQTAQKISGRVRTNKSNSLLNFFWQFRTLEQSEWQLIQGANDSFYIPTLSNQSAFYRRAIYVNGCIDTVFSNPVFVEVFEVLQSRVIPSQTSICMNQILDSNYIRNFTANQNLATFKWLVNGNLVGQSPAFPSMKVSFIDTLLIVLETSDLRGCGKSRDSTIIAIKHFPSVRLQFEQLNDCSPAKVMFSPVVQHANRLIWNWGDGRKLDTTSITNFEKILFTNSSRNFSVQVTAVNDCGIDTSSVSLTVQPNLTRIELQLMGIDKKGCVPFTSYWKNRSVGVQSFVWDFGDGSKRIISGQQDTIYHKYAAAGKYEVKVIAQTSCGDTLIREFLYVFAKPHLDFTFTPQTGCVGDTVVFNNKSDQELQFQWRFPSGSIQSGFNTKHIFRNAGQFPVTLIGYQEYDDGIRCSDSLQKIVPVVSGLPGTINLSDTTVYCAPFTFQFQQFNTVAKQTVWDFGSGLKDTGTIVSHTYHQTGNYTTRMMAITDGGCVYEREIRIQVIAPEGQLQVNTTTLCNSQELKLFVNGKNTSKYEWNDGLGNTFITTNPSINFKYSQAGLFHPSVSLLNDAGCRVPLHTNMPIQVQKIKADFIVEQKSVCDTVQLKLQNITGSNADLQYAWRFNASAFSSVKSPAAMSITQSGIQSIQLIAKDELGCADTILQHVPVRVYKKPIVQVNALKDICVGDIQQAGLLIQADTTIQSIAWRLNGQVNTSDTIFRSVFQSPGSQIIQANISTAAGCAVEVERKFLVRPLPNIRVQGDTVVCKEQPVQIEANGGEKYRWLNGNAVSCIDCSTTLAFPSASGFVRVRGTNQWGCSANDSIYIHVAKPIQIQTKDVAFCEGGSGQIGVTGGQRYTWMPTQGLDNPTAAQTNVRVNRTSTFQVVGYDRWGCYTDTTRVQVVVHTKPRIIIKRDSIVAAGSQVVLRAQVNSQSQIESIRWSPGSSLSCTNCFEPVATVRNDQTYQVAIKNRDGCEQTDSIRFRTICTQAQLYIPNTFTPDGDGLNDRLIVRGTQITKILSFTIFNRWGSVVFRQQNFAPNDPTYGWDGTIGGKKADADVFVVLCEFLCENDRKVLYKGNVTLIR